VLIALFPLTYYVTHASPDYRQPIEPEIIVLAVVGAGSLSRRLGGDIKRTRSVEDEVQMTEPTAV